MDNAPRPLEALYALVSLAWMGLIVWERLDPDGPQDAWQRLREAVTRQWQEYRGYREAMQRTLEEISELPEAERGRAP